MLKKFLTRLLPMWILAIGMLLAFNTAVYAKSSDNFPGVSRSCVIRGYCYRVHDVKKKRVYVYTNEACSRRNSKEYVNMSADECYITGTSGRYNNVRITYPTSSGRKERWTVMGVFTSATSYKTKCATTKIPTYKFASAKYGYGSINVNDQVRVYETWGKYVRVIYPVSGGYKIAWITKANADKYLAGYAKVAEGTYKIASMLNSSYVLDVNNYATFNGGNVEIYPYHDTNNEKWKINSVGNGYYRITDVNSGKCLDVDGGKSASGTNVQIWNWNNSNAQRWRFLSAGNGSCYIVNANGCYLDVQNGTVRNGNNVWVYRGNGTSAQKWKLTGVSVKKNNNSSNSETPQTTDIANVLDKNLLAAATSLGLKRDYSMDEDSFVYISSGAVKSTSMVYAPKGRYSRSCSYLKGESYYQNRAGKWSAYIQDKTYSLYGIKIGMTPAKATQQFGKYKWKVVWQDASSCMYMKNSAVILTNLKNGKITGITYLWQMESEI